MSSPLVKNDPEIDINIIAVQGFDDIDSDYELEGHMALTPRSISTVHTMALPPAKFVGNDGADENMGKQTIVRQLHQMVI